MQMIPPLVYWVSGQIIYWVASIALIFLVARMILDWIVFFSPTWRPRGVLLIVANLITAITDPPLRALRRRIPPLRLGQAMALDVGFMVLFVSMLVLMRFGTYLWVQGLS